jgi:cytidylate kinase
MRTKILTRHTAPNKVIAIDGTAASGKGTIARKLSQALNLPHLDTGKLYRFVAYHAMQAQIALDNEPAIVAAAPQFLAQLSAQDLEKTELTNDECSRGASLVAAMPTIRQMLFEYQRNFAANEGGAILDGRDIGTVICPDAILKLYVDARLEIRAERRFKELQNRGLSDTYDAILADMRERDARDKGRADAPLKVADDAIIIDTTDMNAVEAFEMALNLARTHLEFTQP